MLQGEFGIISISQMVQSDLEEVHCSKLFSHKGVEMGSKHKSVSASLCLNCTVVTFHPYVHPTPQAWEGQKEQREALWVVSNPIRQKHAR